MPETAVDEHGDPASREDNVCGPSDCWNWPQVEAVAKAERVQVLAERYLGSRIARRLEAHRSLLDATTPTVSKGW